MSLKEEILINRYLLIRSYLYLSSGSQREQAQRLTETAIRLGYVENRSPISGQTSRKWVKEKNPPAWACKAASAILLANQYKPSSEIEKLVWAYYLRETGHLKKMTSEQFEMVKEILPSLENISI